MAVVVGITGGIGTGKSTVLAMFENLGAEIASADVVAREVLSPGRPATAEVIRQFGDEILLPGGEIDRRKLGELVFGDEEAREKLNRITHPRIISKIEEIIRDFRVIRGRDRRSVLAIEIPLLFECNMKSTVDKVVVVAAEQQTVLNRLISRDDLSEEAARARLKAQMPLSEKIAQADWVIWTDKGIDDVRSQVSEVFRELTV